LITGAVNIVTTLIAIAFVDKFAHEPLLLIGSINMTLTLGTLTTIFANAALDAAGNPSACSLCWHLRASSSQPVFLLRILLGAGGLGAVRRNV